MIGRYMEITRSLIERLAKADALEDFRNLCLVRAEMTARDLMGGNDDAVLHALRGQLSILFELADAARQAHEGNESTAKPDFPEGIPDV